MAYNSLLVFPKSVMCHAKYIQACCFPPKIPELSTDGKAGSDVLDGLVKLSQYDVGISKIAQGVTLSPTVPNLALHGKAGSLESDGLPILPKREVAETKVA